jgi:hypothetical protein
MTSVYLVLGLPGSGRHELVSNLIDDGLPDSPAVSVYLAPGDAVPTNEGEASPLSKLAKVTIVPYTFDKDHFVVPPEGEPEEEPDTVFFLANGRISVIDQLEAFGPWLKSRGWELARILLVVDSTLAAAQPKVEEWYEVGVHFADCVLMNRRTVLNQTWVQQFQKKFFALRYPCQFMPVKQGRVDNAMVALFPEPRRMTLTFDDIDPIDQLDLDEENLPEEPFNLENKPDPYFERLPSGHRCKHVPDVTAFLPK